VSLIVASSLSIFTFTDTLGGEVGLAISACMSLTGELQYGMRQSAELENQMTSVERVAEYGNLELEADLTKPNIHSSFIILMSHCSSEASASLEILLIFGSQNRD